MKTIINRFRSLTFNYAGLLSFLIFRRGLLYPPSHSRRAALGTLASSASCFRRYRFVKRIINPFRSLTFNHAGLLSFDILSMQFFVIFPTPFAYSYIVSQSFWFFKRFWWFFIRVLRGKLTKLRKSCEKILTRRPICAIIPNG